ncbi:MAG: M28 family peptidase [Planctomycetota bacterium]|nr:M28 family peptidase [Planctomycetota bacterium]
MRSSTHRTGLVLATGLATFLCSTAASATEDVDRIREAMNESPLKERVFNEHITVLSSPWMEGRLPGTRGMEYAREYVAYWFDQAGLEPGFTDPETGERSWLQPFPLGMTRVFDDQVCTVDGKEELELALGDDFELTGLGSDGTASGDLVFVGYSIDDGPEGYQSFPEDLDLEGKIAVMLRFEPMDENGDSRWNERRWSRKSTFSSKFGALKKRNPAGVILVNTPGADDDRIGTLMKDSSQVIEGIPVVMVTPDAGRRIVAATDPEGRSIDDLRRSADEETTVVMLDGTATIGGRVDETPMMAENVMGLLPGRGELADEVVIIGGHLDHLGMGEFGSRRGSGNLHPGADDNASGAAALMMLGESLRQAYDELPEGTPARSVLFAAFDAEESGLNGSRFYVENPTFDLDDIQLMINFDMIGRVTDDRLSITGVDSADGMDEWTAPMFEASGLEIVKQEGMRGGGSDHASFYRKGIPVLFAICADFHDDYHTPDDTPDKIYRTAGVKTVDLFHEIAYNAATRPERFEFASGGSDARSGGPARPRALRVRLGIRSRPLPDGEGLQVVSVSEGSTAADGGIEADDVIKKWDKIPLKTRADLVGRLAELKPGDEVQVVIERDGEEQVKFLKMKAAG